MEALLDSLAVVAVAEIGDRTQLLSLLLASRFRRPIPIICGIFVATLANHALAGLAGQWIGEFLTPAVLRWVLVLSFLGMAAWALVPDKLDEEGNIGTGRHGPFIGTVMTFFVAEIGDKTEIATAALAARFDTVPSVVVGTTIGMMIANIPVVLFGHFAGSRFDPRWARYAAAAIFAIQAALTLAGYSLV